MSAHPHFGEVAVIGTGLVGTSLLMALKKAGVVDRTVGYDANRARVHLAKERGAIDRIADSAGEAAASANLVVLATPVGTLATVLGEIAPVLSARPQTLITDVGSTKAQVVADALRILPHSAQFVGGHPIAGLEKSGPEVARADLFIGRTCLLTPVANTDPHALSAVHGVWLAAGATRVVELAPAEHDRMLAFTSHLPHAVAFALAAAVGGEAASLSGLAAGGFADTTRIAASDLVMWRDIFLANRESLLSALDHFEREWGKLRRAIATEDARAMRTIIEAAHAGRQRILEGGQ